MARIINRHDISTVVIGRKRANKTSMLSLSHIFVSCICFVSGYSWCSYEYAGSSMFNIGHQHVGEFHVQF